MTTEGENIKITRLINSIYYGLEVAFIVILEDGYRLITFQNKRVLIDQTYPTQRGARIAFTKYYKNQKMFDSEKVEIKPDWSLPYTPDDNWKKRYFDPKLFGDTDTNRENDGKAAAVG